MRFRSPFRVPALAADDAAVGDLLVVLGDSPTAASWRANVNAAAVRLGLGAPRSHAAGDGFAVWTFTRADGSGADVATDPDRGWLASAGSWYDSTGSHAAGDESHLLQRCDPDSGLVPVASELDGFFALCHGSVHRPDRIQLLTDPIGNHHVSVRAGDGVLAVACSPALLAALDPAVTLDPVAAQEFLSTGILYEDRTLWNEVRKLPPGVLLELGPGHRRELLRTFDLPSLAAELRQEGELAGDAAVEAFAAGIRSALDRILPTFRRPMSDLTAGWDSRLLTAFLLDRGADFATTVTGPEDCADVRIAAQIAARFGIDHRVSPITIPTDRTRLERTMAYCDGEVDVVDYARIAAIQETYAGSFHGSFNGSFGEVARGYWWEILQPSPSARRPLDCERVARLRYAAGTPSHQLWPTAERLEPRRHFAGILQRCDQQIEDATLALRLDHTYLRMRMRCWHGRIASSTDRIWPCVSPLAFRSVLEPLLRTRPAERHRNRLAARTLARYAPDLARMPLEAGGTALPRGLHVAWRSLPPVWVELRRKFRALRRRGQLRASTGAGAARLALWQDPTTRAWLESDDWALGETVDRDALRKLLRASREPQFALEPVFGRLLALELALGTSVGVLHAAR